MSRQRLEISLWISYAAARFTDIAAELQVSRTPVHEAIVRLLVADDLVFLDRAPTTPDADLGRWRASLASLKEVGHGRIAPGHGPAETGARGIDDTRD